MAGILIVEDDNDLREMLKVSLLRRKYTVLESSNGKEAILKLKPALIDLVITDIIMPDEDGLKVIMKFREIKPSIKIIAISGGGKAGPANYLSMARALGADEIFPKPFSINALLSKVDEIIEGINKN
ncbi:MAG TPA: response regulator [Bacteroidales bacterium]|nr:response regulator [Bacteroidales bacterium]